MLIVLNQSRYSRELGEKQSNALKVGAINTDHIIRDNLLNLGTK